MAHDRPFYGTVWFSVLVTLAILIAVPFFALVVIGQSSSDEDLQRSGARNWRYRTAGVGRLLDHSFSETA